MELFSTHWSWVWAQQNKWQSVNVDACGVGEQEGFIRESKTTKARDICSDTEQNVCRLKYIPKKPLKLYLPMLEKDVFVYELFVILRL